MRGELQFVFIVQGSILEYSTQYERDGEDRCVMDRVQCAINLFALQEAISCILGRARNRLAINRSLIMNRFFSEKRIIPVIWINAT